MAASPSTTWAETRARGGHWVRPVEHVAQLDPQTRSPLVYHGVTSVCVGVFPLDDVSVDVRARVTYDVGVRRVCGAW